MTEKIPTGSKKRKGTLFSSIGERLREGRENSRVRREEEKVKRLDRDIPEFMHRSERTALNGARERYSGMAIMKMVGKLKYAATAFARQKEWLGRGEEISPKDLALLKESTTTLGPLLEQAQIMQSIDAIASQLTPGSDEKLAEVRPALREGIHKFLKLKGKVELLPADTRELSPELFPQNEHARQLFVKGIDDTKEDFVRWEQRAENQYLKEVFSRLASEANDFMSQYSEGPKKL